MGNGYELIKKIENTPDFLSMLKKGWIPITILDKRIYYEFYKQEFEACGNSWEAIIRTSDNYKVSESTIRRAIKFMEK